MNGVIVGKCDEARVIRWSRVVVQLAVLTAGVGSVFYIIVALRSRNADREHYIQAVSYAQSQVNQGQTELALAALADTEESLRNWEWGWLEFCCRNRVPAARSTDSDNVNSASFEPNEPFTGIVSGDAEARKPGNDVKDIPTASDETTTQQGTSPDEVSFSYTTISTYIVPFVPLGKKSITLDGSVLSECSSPDGSRLVIVSEDGTTRVYDMDSCRELVTLSGRSGISSADFSSDGMQILARTEDGIEVFQAMPWRAKDLPGDDTMTLDQRLELWNRERIKAARSTVE